MPQADSKNSSGQVQQQTAQTVSYPTPYPQQFEDDTIDLYKLWINLWNRKWLVIAVTVVAALGSVVYALQLQHVYRAEALLLPPKTKDIHTINNLPILSDTVSKEDKPKSKEGKPKSGKGMPDIGGISSGVVFSSFRQNLNSRTVLKKFIQEYGLMELLAPAQTPETRDEDIYKGFSELIILKDVKGATSLSIELHDAEIAAQWVNDLIEFVDKETITMLVKDSRNSIANQIRNITYTIESKRLMVKRRKDDQIEGLERSISVKRKMALHRRSDKIERYEEAAKTAKSLGIVTGLTQQTQLVQSTSGGVSPITSREKLLGTPPIAQMNVDIATATTPLFFIGFDALDAELKVLKERVNDDPFIPALRDLQEQLAMLKSVKSDDPFIAGLRDLQEQLALLRSIKFDQENMTAVFIDQAAYPPKSPIKPNRRSIVSFATLVGLFSGIFLAFFIEYVQNQRKKHSE